MHAAEVRRTLGLLTALLAFITGCQSTQKMPTDRSILTDDPCATPCWQGILPGKTTIDEADAILDTLGIDYHRFDREVYWHRPYYRDDGFAFQGNVLLGSEYGDPTTVSLVHLGLEFELTLQEILDKYGPPEKFQAVESDLPLLLGGHAPGIIVSLLYPERGLTFEIWLLGLRPARLDPNTTLKAVFYFTPTSMERLFIDVTEMRGYLRRDSWKELQDWQGLGPIPEVH